MKHFNIKHSKKIIDNQYEIYDYSDTDLKVFCEKYSNKIIHPIEARLIK